MAIVFNLVQMVMLVNTLIAMMAKTFDRISGNTLTFFYFLKARQTHSWVQYPEVPPPLNALAMPYVLIVLPIYKLATCVKGMVSQLVSQSPSETAAYPSIGHIIAEESQSVPRPGANSVFTFNDSWKAQHDVEKLVGVALTFGREEEIQAEALGKQVYLLSQRFDILLEKLEEKPARPAGVRWTAPAPYVPDATEGGQLSSEASARRKGLAGMAEAARRKMALSRRDALQRAAVAAFTAGGVRQAHLVPGTLETPVHSKLRAIFSQSMAKRSVDNEEAKRSVDNEESKRSMDDEETFYDLAT